MAIGKGEWLLRDAVESVAEDEVRSMESYSMPEDYIPSFGFQTKMKSLSGQVRRHSKLRTCIKAASILLTLVVLDLGMFLFTGTEVLAMVMGFFSSEKPTEYFCKQDVGDYTVYIYSGDARRETDETSPYFGMSEGTFYIDTFQGNKRIDSVIYEILGEKNTYFYKGFALEVTDYNKDGLPDFALGNRINSNYFAYTFYSVDKDGRLRKMLDHNGKTVSITADNDGFSPLFKNRNNSIYFNQYDQFLGKVRECNVILSTETQSVHTSIEETGEDPGETVPVTAVTVDPEDKIGSDTPSILYVDQDRLIVTFYKGVFVYDKKEHKLIRTLDRRAIGCEVTQGDGYASVYASEDGKTVYLSCQEHAELYIYDVEENTLVKKPYVEDLYDKVSTFKHFARVETSDDYPDGEYVYYDCIAWYINDSGNRIYTTIEPFKYNLIDLAFRENDRQKYAKKADTYECIFKDEYVRDIELTGLSGDTLVFRDLAYTQDYVLNPDESDDAYFTGQMGVGSERTVPLSSKAKFSIYDGKINDEGLEELSKVSEKRFRKYVKKELKNRKIKRGEEKTNPNISVPYYDGIPFKIWVKDGVCVKIQKGFEV